jgi:predicted dehydrogenase
MTTQAIRLALLGAGVIGRQHVHHMRADDSLALAAIVDPMPVAQAWAAELGVPWHPDLASLLAAGRPDGVIVATPTQSHVELGLQCIAAGLPTLMEKPIANEVPGATRLVEAAEAAGVPLLVGHHRRHNPLLQPAKQAIDSGRLGRLVVVHAICWFHKPAGYFAPAWRRAPGAGPILTNIIHDIDLLRALCGEVASVQAEESSAVRGHAVEDTAAILLRFASGVLGTVAVSDTIAAPWNWELTVGENPDYTQTPESCILLGGTRGSLSLPYLDLWSHAGTPDWMAPIGAERLPTPPGHPLALQLRNFAAVIRGTQPPVVSGREGLNTLKVVAAIHQAAATGQTVAIA